MTVQNETGEYFDLPTELEIELTRYNVLLCDMGEQTAPITLPGSPHNLKLVGYSNRIDSLLKPLTDLTVLVSDGLFVRWCNMGIHTANEEEGISCTLYFGSGEFYSRIGNTRLNWLSWPIIKSPTFNTQSLGQRVQYLINYMKAEYDNPTQFAQFSVRPVATSQEFTWHVHRLKANNTYEWVNLTGLFVLNGFEKYSHPLDFEGSGQDQLETFEGESSKQMIVDVNTINISTGYGMTPFLKLHYMLEFIFEKFGYYVELRAAEELSEEFDNIAVLNNVADAIYSGILNFKQLVPDVTVKEFIAEIEKTFAGKFVVNEVTKTAYLCLYSNVLNEYPDIDLTAYSVSKPKLGTPEFSSIKIQDKSISTSNSDETEEKSIAIEFDFVSEVVIEDSYTAPDLIDRSALLMLNMVKIDSITHLNSSVQVNGETTKETPATSKLVQLMTIRNKWENAGFRTDPNAPVSVRYKCSNRLFIDLDDHETSPLRSIDWFYTSYQNFKLNSNIPIEMEMNIPEEVLGKLNYSVPKLLHGQNVMIEKIVEKRGSTNTQSKTQNITFRTLRSFTSRN